MSDGYHRNRVREISEEGREIRPICLGVGSAFSRRSRMHVFTSGPTCLAILSYHRGLASRRSSAGVDRSVNGRAVAPQQRCRIDVRSDDAFVWKIYIVYI